MTQTQAVFFFFTKICTMCFGPAIDFFQRNSDLGLSKTSAAFNIYCTQNDTENMDPPSHSHLYLVPNLLTTSPQFTTVYCQDIHDI